MRLTEFYRKYLVGYEGGSVTSKVTHKPFNLMSGVTAAGLCKLHVACDEASLRGFFTDYLATVKSNPTLKVRENTFTSAPFRLFVDLDFKYTTDEDESRARPPPLAEI